MAGGKGGLARSGDYLVGFVQYHEFLVDLFRLLTRHIPRVTIFIYQLDLDFLHELRAGFSGG